MYMIFEMCVKYVAKDGGGPHRGPSPSFSTYLPQMVHNFYRFAHIGGRRKETTMLDTTHLRQSKVVATPRRKQRDRPTTPRPYEQPQAGRPARAVSLHSFLNIPVIPKLV